MKSQDKNKTKTKQQEEVSVLKDQLARALADYDNLLKRTQKQQEEYYKMALIKITTKFLPFFDMLTSAQKYTKDSGLAIALGEFENILKEEGVIKIKAEKGQEFDQTVHEAVDKIADAPKGVIAELVLDGWKMLDGTVIRYAKVIVE